MVFLVVCAGVGGPSADDCPAAELDIAVSAEPPALPPLPTSAGASAGNVNGRAFVSDRSAESMAVGVDADAEGAAVESDDLEARASPTEGTAVDGIVVNRPVPVGWPSDVVIGGDTIAGGAAISPTAKVIAASGSSTVPVARPFNTLPGCSRFYSASSRSREYRRGRAGR